MVASKSSTAAGSGAATTHPEAAAVGKSRGETTLNWVITWKFKWLHKCITAAAAAAAHGTALGECFFLVLLPAQARGGCEQNPHKKETLAGAHSMLPQQFSAAQRSSFCVADGGAEAQETRGSVTQSSCFGSMAGLPSPLQLTANEAAPEEGETALLCRAAASTGREGSTREQVPRMLHPSGTRLGITPFPRALFCCAFPPTVSSMGASEGASETICL